MSSLLDAPRLVHSKSIEVLEDRDPTPPDDELYVPTEADMAWWVSFQADYEGCPAAIPSSSDCGYDQAVQLRWCSGRSAGVKARAIDDARELGRALGITTGISEPPAGYSAEEQAAYRDGFRQGLGELAEAEEQERRWAEEDARFEAWVAMEERERYEEISRVEIQDADVWPMGCMS